MSAEKGSSKTDTLVKVVLVFFISLLSFSVGTFVGKQVSDSDHRRLALEGEYKTDRSVASTEGAKPEAESADKISDKEVESLTEEFVAKEKPAEGETVAKASEEEDKDDAEAAPAAAPKTEEKADASGYKTYKREKVAAAPAKPAPVEPKATEERKPASTLPSVASSAVGKFTVQVGSYSDEKEAKTHAAELKGKGWNTFYFSANVAGRTMYRVSVGLFKDASSAKEFRAQFMKDSGTKSAIVQKIVQ